MVNSKDNLSFCIIFKRFWRLSKVRQYSVLKGVVVHLMLVPIVLVQLPKRMHKKLNRTPNYEAESHRQLGVVQQESSQIKSGRNFEATVVHVESFLALENGIVVAEI